MSENFSEEEELIHQADESEEIEFDDNIDIDALQNQLRDYMAGENVNYTPEPAIKEAIAENQAKKETPEFITKEEPEIVTPSDSVLIPAENSDGETLELDNFIKSMNIDNISKEDSEKPIEDVTAIAKKEDKPKIQICEKKYVIYIEPDNIEFIENLSLKERKKIINRLLHEEDVSIKKKKEYDERIKFINQVIVMVLTVVIALPVFFVLLNKSIEITILNYQQSQQKFIKLYKEQGKIKSYKKFQNKF